MRESLTPDEWADYVAGYHDANPGITEDVLADARDHNGRTPYDWLVEAVPAGASTVVDLACGSAPLARLLTAPRVVGIDQSAPELALGRQRAGTGPGLLIRALASALPVADACADAVVVSMALMLLHPLDAVLAEIGRLLRPDGTVAAILPMRATSTGPDGTATFARILAALGQSTKGYPERLDDATLGDRFSARGLALATDETRLFARTVADPADAGQVIRSFYAPGVGPDRVTAAVAALQDQVRSAPVTITYRIRRLVARR